MKLGPFARRRQQRRDDRELGHHLWRQAHDRFHRSLQRYWQIVDPDEEHARNVQGFVSAEEHNGLINAGNILADLLPRVRALCVAARRASPDQQSLDVPGEFQDLHRWISRAANDLAAVAQAAAMFRRGQTEVYTVGRRAQKVIEDIEAAEAALPDLTS
ncbi:hypothetical protein DCC27_007355 [Auritidibacter sp. NML130574]|uniref:hypothetical protein n=1 Tax=Auritidibacter sp. NML130574 TaxID=2170745 RepID=UPI000D739510|nr:hypothetical protein [Auritidibacter sp. NML130574]AXR74140.1 hypothetical protein DCC27_007355 [Auritidibacter sp. NML130574]